MTPAQKLEANLTAIRVLVTLQREQREATEEERRTLALYTGWGDTSVRKLAIRYDETPSVALLRALGVETPTDQLVYARADDYSWAYHGDGEWASRWDDESDPRVASVLHSIARSTLNAHYTPIPIVRAMWDMLAHLGLSDLRAPWVLEPSCGVGHFLGHAPIDGADLLHDRIVGVELDQISAAITRALYPRNDVRQGSFEETSRGLPAVFDVVIGNVPFGDYGVADLSGEIPPACMAQVHDYFVARSVSLLRPGGVAVLITSKGTLDKKNNAVRRWLNERAELVAAFRLPGDAFQENAGTQVTADVIILRRRDSALQIDAASVSSDTVEWLGLSPVTYPHRHGTESDEVNSYFVSHPDHVLGEWCHTQLAGFPSAGVRRRDGDPGATEMLRAMIGRLPAGALQRSREPLALRQPTITGAGDLAPVTPQELSLGRVLRSVRRIVADTESGADPSAARRMLGIVYGAYTAAYGQIRAAEKDRRHPFHKYIDERWWSLVAGLEDDRGQKTGIFVGPLTTSGALPAPTTAVDALYQVIDACGAVDLDRVLRRLEAP